MNRLIYGLIGLSILGETIGEVSVLLETNAGLNSDELKNELIKTAIERHKISDEPLVGEILFIEEVKNPQCWASIINWKCL